MSLVAFRIGSEPVFSYSVLLALGLLVGVLDLALETARRGWPDERALEIMAWALVPAALAGRLAYVAALGSTGDLHLGQLVRPWGAGLLFPAVVAGGALGLAGLAAWRRLRWLELAGAALPGLAFGQALGWLAAAVHGSAAGVPIPVALWGLQLRNLYGTVVPRFPVQYIAALLSLLAWGLMVRRLPGDRERAACYSLLTGWGFLGLDWWREDRTVALAGLSVEQVCYLALGMLGLALLTAPLWRRSTAPVGGRPRTA